MNVVIDPSHLSGQIKAIASKSYAHRLLICAAIADGPCTLVCDELSDDIIATANCLTALGAEVKYTDGRFNIVPIKTAAQCASLDVGESGSTLRFILPLVCALGAECDIHMHGRLPKRPLSPLYEELIAHGIILSMKGKNPMHVSGVLKNTDFSIAGNVSSQFITGLMLAGAVSGSAEVNITSELQSASYVDITTECLETFGVNISKSVDIISVSGKPRSPGKVNVQGDWSNAAFWLCAGAIGKAPITVTGLRLDSSQGDRKILDVLKSFGVKMDIEKDRICVYPSALSPVTVDAGDIPDLVPVISVVCACADGESRICNAARLRIKESDRLKAVNDMLTALGCDITELDDGLIIKGGKMLHGGCVDSVNDHRIAMSAAVASTVCSGAVEICGAEAVNKSYPGFYKDFAALGGIVNEQI